MLGNAAQKTLPNTDPKTMTNHGTSRHKAVTFNGRYSTTPTLNELFLNHIQNTPTTPPPAAQLEEVTRDNKKRAGTTHITTTKFNCHVNIVNMAPTRGSVTQIPDNK